MNLNGPVHDNMQEAVRDIEAITKEVIAIITNKEKTDDDKKRLCNLTRLYAKKEAELNLLIKEYKRRIQTKLYIEELKECVKVKNMQLECFATGFQKMYNNLAELTHRVESATEINKPEVKLDIEDVIKASYLYSKANSVQAPDKNPTNYRPYPTAEELQKGTLMEESQKNQIKAKQYQRPSMKYDYIPCSNPPTAEMKDMLERYRAKFNPLTMGSSTQLEKYYKSNSEAEKKKKKKNKFWTHYRESYEPMNSITPWNEKAFTPVGYIESSTKSSGGDDGGAGGSQNNNQRPSTPEFPTLKLIPIQEKHSIFYKALTENDEKDLFFIEEPLKPPSVQSCDMVDANNMEDFERYNEITEHSKQKYYNSFTEEVIPWLQVKGKERYRKKPNQRFRLTTSAYFGEQQKIAKRIVWNAKYNRFYRDYKYRTPRLCSQNFIFPPPNRKDDNQRPPLNDAELCWNLRKWAPTTILSTPNA